MINIIEGFYGLLFSDSYLQKVNKCKLFLTFDPKRTKYIC